VPSCPTKPTRTAAPEGRFGEHRLSSPQPFVLASFGWSGYHPGIVAAAQIAVANSLLLWSGSTGRGWRVASTPSPGTMHVSMMPGVPHPGSIGTLLASSHLLAAHRPVPQVSNARHKPMYLITHPASPPRRGGKAYDARLAAPGSIISALFQSKPQREREERATPTAHRCLRRSAPHRSLTTSFRVISLLSVRRIQRVTNLSGHHTYPRLMIDGARSETPGATTTPPRAILPDVT
jgi:hypothetical protein